MHSILTLLERSAAARAAANWASLEEISIEILRLIYKESKVDEDTLRTTLQNYLSSIVGSGEFLTNLQSREQSKYGEELAKLLEWPQIQSLRGLLDTRSKFLELL